MAFYIAPLPIVGAARGHTSSRATNKVGAAGADRRRDGDDHPRASSFLHVRGNCGPTPRSFRCMCARTPLTTAANLVPPHPTLRSLRSAAATCRACPLWKNGTQTVFGEGPPSARVIVVGEQPGDQEDRTGRPFVGPAGRLLDEAMEAAGLDRSEVYVTNAVKHFKWEPAGQRRLHKKPSAREIAACRPWLEAEIAVLRPELVIALGATAAQTLMGKAFRVTLQRGRRLDAPWGSFLATIHPSAILRMQSAERAAARREFIADLKVAAELVHKHA